MQLIQRENKERPVLPDCYGGLPYYSLDAALRRQFGGKVYKLALSSGCTCPNRDGRVGSGGCSFCGEGGAGEFAAEGSLPIAAQLEEAKARVQAKCSKSFAGYIAYFQSFSNTYGPLERLGPLFEAAIRPAEVLALSLATRPDCLEVEMLRFLSELNRRKPVWVELGLQTMHEDTARLINRGYELPVFEEALRRLKAAGLTAVVHVIAGLPGEDAARTKETVRYLAGLGQVDGIKLHLLHVMRGTRLAKQYGFEPKNEPDNRFGNESENEPLPDPSASLANSAQLDRELPPLFSYSLEAYADLVVDLIELLPPDLVVHRITGDAPKRLLLSPLWTGDKKRVLNTIHRRFRERGAFQSRCFEPAAF